MYVPNEEKRLKLLFLIFEFETILMPKILFILLSLILFEVKAQSVLEIHNEINTTVWRKFQTAFETMDAEALNNLYAKEVLRVTPNGIDTEELFKKANIERFKANKADNIRIGLDFWLDSRKTNAHTSYEVGYYRIRLEGEDATQLVYGQFHIVLKKIDGKWKIVQDWDTDEINGQKITAADFEKGKPIRF